MVQLSQILELLGVASDLPEGNIEKAKSILDESFGANDLGWCSDKNIANLNNLKAGYVLVTTNTFTQKHEFPQLKLIAVENPRLSMTKVLRAFFAEKTEWGVVDATARIHESVQYNPDKVNIGANVIIEKNCVIGDHVAIDANTVIKSDTSIGNEVTIGANNVIGAQSYGYEKDETGDYTLMPHVGTVHIADKVEIGNNSSVDRATMGTTIVGRNSKVGSHVHVGHNVEIGENSLIISNITLGGSSRIGSNVWLGPCSFVMQKVTIGDNVMVGASSLVNHDVEDGVVVAGVPATVLRKR